MSTTPVEAHAVAELLEKYDKDGDGEISASEMVDIENEIEETKKEARNWKHVAALIALLSLIGMDVMAGLMVLSNEVSKEQHTKGGAIVDLQNNIVKVSSADTDILADGRMIKASKSQDPEGDVSDNVM
jgi:hypothetical protein